MSSDESAQAIFERCVGAIVRSVDPSERQAWRLFYDNTLAALRDPVRPGAEGGAFDFIGAFRAIYECCVELIDEVPCARVLDVATCFGFLPLFLADSRRAEAGAPAAITGCDLNAALVSLADDYRRQRALDGVAFVRADVLDRDFGLRLEGESGGFDVVTAIHLLEHLEPEQTAPAFDHLWAVARRRLIIAVPFEESPDATFGHRQVFDEARLRALGRRTGARARCFTRHGGWLVVDRDPGRIGAGEISQ